MVLCHGPPPAVIESRLVGGLNAEGRRIRGRYLRDSLRDVAVSAIDHTEQAFCSPEVRTALEELLVGQVLQSPKIRTLLAALSPLSRAARL